MLGDNGFMKNLESNKRPLVEVAGDFFSYLGRHLPQQCASDEFYFLPRSEAAIEHLSSLDDLTPEELRHHVEYVQNLLDEISFEEREGLEEEIDRLLLKQSMESFLREFHDEEVWRNDPTLYVKVPLIATEQVISQRDRAPDVAKASLRTLLGQMPSFLSSAMKNLRSPSQISKEVALDMTQDALRFYSSDIRALVEERMGNRELFLKIEEVLSAWEKYKKGLQLMPSKQPFAVGEAGLKKILSVSLRYPRSLGEIVEITQNAYRNTQEKILKLARKINNNRPWTKIIYEQLPELSSPAELLRLYRREVRELRRFFYAQDIMTFHPGEKVTVLQTPSYLQSLRATASYRAPLTGMRDGHGLFYITPGKEDIRLISAHCPYLSAHETYPGHHVLDHLRVHHPNPIRRQFESPLFYEGWACYAEQLLNELGYIQDPRQHLILLKRQLWRSLRAILDVELQSGKTTLAEAAKEIESLGFSPQRAQRQVRRFCLTPGYQLCYFMGAYEIFRLRERYASQIGLKQFHDVLLGGGQMPFRLAEKRLQAAKYSEASAKE